MMGRPRIYENSKERVPAAEARWRAAGRRRVVAWLSPEALDALEKLKESYDVKTDTAMINIALREYGTQNQTSIGSCTKSTLRAQYEIKRGSEAVREG